MAKYSIELTRVVYSYLDIEIEADSEAEAKEKAEIKAYELDFISVNDIEFKVDNIKIIE